MEKENVFVFSRRSPFQGFNRFPSSAAMNLRNFPKRLDSKTSCLRITVPDNLDLALEGLIRKMLREQPKTEEIYAFAAEYFEKLLQIREKTGAKLTPDELCPFHNDEDAHEMIKLAGSFPKPPPKNVRTKPEQSKNPVRKKEPGGNVVAGEKSKKGPVKRKPLELLKQTTPDLIKKLPMVKSQSEKENKVEVEENEEYLTSDPIKELVEKELMEADLKKKKTDGKEKTENEGNIQQHSKKVIETIKGKPKEEKTGTEKAVKEAEALIPKKKASVPIPEALLPKKDSTSTTENPVPVIEAPVFIKDSTVSKEETPTPTQEAPLIIEEETQNMEEPNKPEETKLRTETKATEEQTNPTELTKLDEQQKQTPKSETQQQQQPKPENTKPQLLDTREKEEEIPSTPDEKETIRERQKTETEISTKIEERTQINTKTPEEKIENVVDTNQKVQETVPVPEPTTKPDEKSNEDDKQTIENKIKHENNSEKAKEDEPEQTPSENDKFKRENTKEEMKQQNTEEMREIPLVEATEKKEKEEKVESGNDEREISKEGDFIGKEDKMITEVKEVDEKEGNDTGKEDKIIEGEDKALKEEHKAFEEGNEVDEEHKVVEKAEKVVEEVEKEDKIVEKEDKTIKRDDKDTKKEDGEVEEGAKVVVEEKKIIEKDENYVKNEDKVVQDEDKALKEEQNVVEEGHKVVDKTEKVVEEDKIVEKNDHIVKENKAADKDGQVAHEENKIVREPEKVIQDDNILEKQHKIDEAQDKLVEIPGTVTETEDKILEKEHKIPEEQGKIVEALQKPVEESHKSVEHEAEVILEHDKVTKTPENVIEVAHKEDKLVEKEPEVTDTAEQAKNNTTESRKLEREDTPLPEQKNQELENPDELCSVVDIDHIPKESNTDEQIQDHSEPTESKEEPQPEELCVVVDIDNIPRENNTNEQIQDHSKSKDPSEQEELCTVVDIDHIPRENKTNEQTQDHSEPTLSKGTSEPEEPCTVVDNERIPTKDNITPEETTANPPNTDQEHTANEEPLTVPDTDHIITVEEVDTTKPSSETGEVQIKTIQAHYYDTLQVPETVTREYRMHSVATPIPDTLQAPTFNTSSAETGIVTATSTPSQHDTHKSESDDLLLTPTSGYSLNLSELSYQTVTGLFLESERRCSSTEKEHEYTQVEELIKKTVVHSVVAAVPIPPRDEDELNEESVVQTSEKPKDSSESFDSSNGRSEDDEIPFISVEVKTVIETQILNDDEDEKIPEVEVKVVTTIDIQNDKETQSFPVEEAETSHAKSSEEIDLKLQRDDRKESDSTEATGREGSTGDSDSISSAVTEIKRTDSGKRNLGSTKGLLATQSLDLGKRNPLVKTRSLSTFRHGVTDFEVWSTIEKELEDAARKIQSKFRGYKTRKKLQRENAVQITTEESSASTTPVETEPKEESQQSTGEFHDSIVLSEHPR